MLTVRYILSSAASASLSIFLMTAPSSGAAMADPAPPETIVTNLDDALLIAMKSASKLGYDGRYKQLEAVLKTSYNFPLMTKIVVGSEWNNWTQEQRDSVTEAFSKFTIATYARRFDGFSGESFQMMGSHPLGNGTLVQTQINRPSDTPVSLSYLLRDTGNGFSIVDVFLTGTISELATRRSEFSAVLQRDGYDGLLAALQKASAPAAKS